MTSKFACFGPGFFPGFFKVGLPKKTHRLFLGTCPGVRTLMVWLRGAIIHTASRHRCTGHDVFSGKDCTAVGIHAVLNIHQLNHTAVARSLCINQALVTVQTLYSNDDLPGNKHTRNFTMMMMISWVLSSHIYVLDPNRGYRRTNYIWQEYSKLTMPRMHKHTNPLKPSDAKWLDFKAFNTIWYNPQFLIF